jgi:hypothetical protein
MVIPDEDAPDDAGLRANEVCLESIRGSQQFVLIDAVLESERCDRDVHGYSFLPAA